MKEKLLKLKEQAMQNKKKAAGIGIAVLLLIGAGGYGIAALNMNNETAKTVQTEKKSVDQKSVKKETADKTSKKVDADKNSDTKDKKTDEKKSSDDKKETKKTENEKKSTAKDNSTKTSDAGSTNSSQPAGNTNTQPSVPEYTPEPDPVPQPEPAPQPEPDPAPPVHTHDYSNPIYEEQSVWIDTSGYVSKEILRCGICDEEVTGFEGKHLEDHALAGEGVGNTYSDWKEVWEESGYWGTESVITGYKCSCGAVQ